MNGVRMAPLARWRIVHQGNTILLGPGELTVGRSPACGLPLDDTEVSRRHAILRVREDQLSVEDLGSRNGIQVNEVPVGGQAELKHGDVVTMGRQTLRVVEEEERDRRAEMATVTSAASDDLRAEIRAGFRASTPAPNSPALARLSRREQDVLRLVALGHTQKEIAEELQVSVKTVETYRTRVNSKMGFESRADLVRFALETGVLTPA